MAEVKEHNGPGVQPCDPSPGGLGARAATGLSKRSLRLDLADMSGKRVSASEHSDSDQDDVNMQEDDVNTLLGVTIGREQRRLMSPTTPAAEKAAAMESQTGWGLGDDDEEDTETDSPKKDQHSSGAHGQPGSSPVGKFPPVLDGPSESTLKLLPSPWTATPKNFETTEKKDADQMGPNQRNRASTGATGFLAEINIKRFLSSFSMPTLSVFKVLYIPRLPAFLSGSKELNDEEGSANRTRRASTFVVPKSPWTDSSNDGRLSGSPLPESTSTEVNSKASRARESPPPGNTSADGKSHDGLDIEDLPELRQVVTNQTYVASSGLSTITSYGDDSRFVNRKKQVNVRVKAIMDSLQDSGIFPSMPSINLEALVPNFAHKRTSSQSKIRSRANSVNVDAMELDSTSQSTKPKLFEKLGPGDLETALDNLTGDIVVMGGYRGSVLRSAMPPHHQVWGAFKIGLNLRKVSLEVGLDPEDEENMESKVFASGMVTHAGPLDVSRRLFERLRSCKNAQEGKLRVHDYGYDWRLSPHLLSRRLTHFLETLQCNQSEVLKEQRGATVIAHSLGGLVTRHAVNQRPELFAGVVYAGTPQHCINILGPLRNGDELLLNTTVFDAQTNFTLRTSFVLLPEDGKCFVDKDTREDHVVDFFNVASWKEYALSPCIAPVLPPLEKKGILPALAGIASKSNNAARPENSLATGIQMSPNSKSSDEQKITIPLPVALNYLKPTLDQTLAFKKETYFRPELEEANLYPPISILYSTDTPTPFAAKVAGRNAIRHKDAYERLIYHSGAGVVLARAAMAPEGYKVVRHGKIRTNRGHVGLLGDLEAIGRCLSAVQRGKVNGIGQGRVRCTDKKIYDKQRTVDKGGSVSTETRPEKI